MYRVAGSVLILSLMAIASYGDSVVPLSVDLYVTTVGNGTMTGTGGTWGASLSGSASWPVVGSPQVEYSGAMAAGNLVIGSSDVFPAGTPLTLRVDCISGGGGGLGHYGWAASLWRGQTELWHENVSCIWGECIPMWSDNEFTVYAGESLTLQANIFADDQNGLEASIGLAVCFDTFSTLAPVCAGDANCDGEINWRDIDYFVAAMNNDLAAWQTLFAPGAPTCEFANNDVNADGTVNWRDIDPLVAVMNTACP